MKRKPPAITELLGTLIKQNPYQFDIFDHSVVIYYDPLGTQNRHRELLISVYRPVAGVEMKELPFIRVVFLVFKSTDTTMEEYYEYLRD